MKLFSTLYFLIVLIIFFISIKLHANNSEHKTSFIPKKLHFQYAGNLGFLSFGPSWSFLKNSIDLEYSIGYVPKFQSTKPIYVSSIKGIYNPTFLLNIKKITFIPLNFGGVVSHVYGERVNKYQNKKQYEKNPYWWIPSLRWGVLSQTSLNYTIENSTLKTINFYFETSVWDLNIYNYFSNSNHKTLSPTQLITFAIGSKFIF